MTGIPGNVSISAIARIIAIVAFGLSAIVASGASASTLVVDRGLPTTNLNNAAAGDRSNVAWGFYDSYWAGDTFTLSTAGTIDQLTLWMVTSPAADFGSTFASLSLYLGSSAGTQISNVASANFVGNVSDNANVSVGSTTYSGGADYQGSSGSFLDIWELTFTDLGLFAAGEYLFALTGSPDEPLFIHASNAALGGAPADGADNLYYYLFGPAGGATLDIGGALDSDGYGWDKSSDLNVAVYLTAVPIPAALPMLLGALGAFGGVSALRRRRIVAA